MRPTGPVPAVLEAQAESLFWAHSSVTRQCDNTRVLRNLTAAVLADGSVNHNDFPLVLRMAGRILREDAENLETNARLEKGRDQHDSIIELVDGLRSQLQETRKAARQSGLQTNR